MLIILLRKRNNYKSTAQENLVDTTTSLNGVQFGSKSGVDKVDSDNKVENKQNETKETDSLILGKHWLKFNAIIVINHLILLGKIRFQIYL